MVGQDRPLWDFVDEGDKWTATAVKNEEVLNEKNEPTFDLYLVRNP